MSVKRVKSLFRQGKFREVKLARQQASKLENMFSRMGAKEEDSQHCIEGRRTWISRSINSFLEDQGNDEVEVRNFWRCWWYHRI